MRDVAATHLAAAEKENASTAVTSAVTRSPLTLLTWWPSSRTMYPNKKFPSHVAGDLNKTFGVDNSKTRKELGIEFTPLDKTLKDMAVKLVELGMVKVQR